LFGSAANPAIAAASDQVRFDGRYAPDSGATADIAKSPSRATGRHSRLPQVANELDLNRCAEEINHLALNSNCIESRIWR
jgi:hypothetical protein